MEAHEYLWIPLRLSFTLKKRYHPDWRNLKPENLEWAVTTDAFKNADHLNHMHKHCKGCAQHFLFPKICPMETGKRLRKRRRRDAFDALTVQKLAIKAYQSVGTWPENFPACVFKETGILFCFVFICFMVSVLTINCLNILFAERRRQRRGLPMKLRGEESDAITNQTSIKVLPLSPEVKQLINTQLIKTRHTTKCSNSPAASIALEHRNSSLKDNIASAEDVTAMLP